MKLEIMNMICDEVNREIGDECEVCLLEVARNNGTARQAISIRRDSVTVCPCIYIDRLLDEIDGGCKSVQDAADEVVGIYHNADPLQYAGVAELDKDQILNRVVYQLVNTKLNQEKLCTMPHKELLDLSAIYRVVVDECYGVSASIAVSYKFCRAYEISVDELDLAARKNTENKSFRVISMAEIMLGMAGVPAEGFQNEFLPMFVLTNETGINGATVLLYSKYFAALSRKLESDLYVMPSSIHEVIAIPAAGNDPNALRGIVAEVNAEVVPDEEILSGSVYKYDLETGKIEIA